MALSMVDLGFDKNRFSTSIIIFLALAQCSYIVHPIKSPTPASANYISRLRVMEDRNYAIIYFNFSGCTD